MARNILLLTSTFPRWEDDAQVPRFILDLGRKLTADFRVHVLAPHAPNAAREETLHGMRVLRHRYFFPESLQTLAYGAGIPNNLRANPLRWLQAPPFFLGQWRALISTIRRFQIELVNSHWMLPQGLTAALARAALGTRHVMTIHSAGLYMLRGWPAGRQLARWQVRHSDAVYSVSRRNLQVLETLVKRPVPAHILPMGIDTEYFAEAVSKQSARRTLQWSDEAKVVLCAGKLSRVKGTVYLIRAFRQVAAQLPAARLVLAGSGPEEAALQREVRTLRLDDRVRFAGQQSRDGVRTHLQACDVVALPSINDPGGQSEGFPVAMLEALAAGRPVVGTRAGGTPEGIEEGKTGFLAPPEDAAALAEALLQVFHIGPDSFAAAARASARRWDWSHIGRHYRDTFNALLEP